MTRRWSTASVSSLTSTIPTNSRNAPPSISYLFSIFTSRSSSSCSVDRCGLGADTTRSGDLLRWQQHVYSTPARATRTEQVVGRRGLAKLRCWQPGYCAPVVRQVPRRELLLEDTSATTNENTKLATSDHPTTNWRAAASPARPTALRPVPGAVDRDWMRDRVATCVPVTPESLLEDGVGW